MKDLVIGAITNYKWEDIEPFVVSLEQSGFDGYKCLLMYQGSCELIQKLEGRGWIIFAHEEDKETGGVTYKNLPDFNICVDRFYHYWAFLQQVEERESIELIIACDVKDVVFQTNPSEALHSIIKNRSRQAWTNEGPCIISSGENIRYKDEPWGWNNINLSFGPEIAATKAKHEIVNAGVIAGFREDMLSLFLHTFLHCRGAPYHVPGGGGPDQAAYNLISPLYKRYVTYESDAWACQAGTVADPSKIEEYRKVFIKQGEPLWDDARALVCNSSKTPYCIVHQYDRVPEWKEKISRMYTDEYMEKYRDDSVN
jgi:hypothetical protein